MILSHRESLKGFKLNKSLHVSSSLFSMIKTHRLTIFEKNKDYFGIFYLGSEGMSSNVGFATILPQNYMIFCNLSLKSVTSCYFIKKR